MIQYTDEQKQAAMKCASEHGNCLAGCVVVLAHFLRLAESELAEARREVKRQQAHLHEGCLNMVSELSALRAERDDLRKSLSHMADTEDDERIKRIAAEAKLARLAEALKVKESRRISTIAIGNILIEMLGYAHAKPILEKITALRETEGGDK